MIWYIIWKYGIIIGMIYFLYEIIKKKTFKDKFKNLGIGILLLSLLCISANAIIGYNFSVENLKFAKKETIELIPYPETGALIYTYIDSNRYHVITKKNNIVEPQSYFNDSVKIKLIKSNKGYIEVHKIVGLKDNKFKWLTTYIPNNYEKYYICIPENTFMIKDGE